MSFPQMQESRHNFCNIWIKAARLEFMANVVDVSAGAKNFLPIHRDWRKRRFNAFDLDKMVLLPCIPGLQSRRRYHSTYFKQNAIRALE